MEIFKQLNKIGYNAFYENWQDLDSMDKNTFQYQSELMLVIMWLYEKHGIWIAVNRVAQVS